LHRDKGLLQGRQQAQPHQGEEEEAGQEGQAAKGQVANLHPPRPRHEACHPASREELHGAVVERQRHSGDREEGAGGAQGHGEGGEARPDLLPGLEHHMFGSSH